MNFNFKKKFGQNFLYDEKVLDNIYKNIHPKSNSLIIEIGPGSGNLTSYLLNFKNNLIAYEIDSELIDHLNNRFKNFSNFKLINKDFLDVNLKDDLSNYEYEDIIIVSNLPYYITTKIIEKVILLDLNISKMIFMMQLEVANRIVSEPNSSNYGALTLFIKTKYDSNIIFNVDKKSFFPEPSVTSCVVLFTKNENLLDIDLKDFYKFLHLMFLSKRKTLNNNLKSNYSKDIIENLYNKFNLSKLIRSEEISFKLFYQMYKYLKGIDYED